MGNGWMIARVRVFRGGPGGTGGTLVADSDADHRDGHAIRPMTAGQRPDRALAFLARLGSEFTAVLDLRDLVTRALASLRVIAGFDSCAIALIDPGNPDVLCIVGATGFRAGLRGEVLPRGQGLHWAAIEVGVPLYVPDAREDPRAGARDDHPGSALYVPLVGRTEVIGALSAHREAVGAFTDEDRELFAVVATHLARALEVAVLHERLREMAATDALTAVANRRFFMERLEAELSRSHRTGHPFSIGLVDLDGFKMVNDKYGHVTGDAVLVRVAQTLRRNTRGYDLVARYGGDEFILLFPETPREKAEKIVRRFRTVTVPIGPQDRPLTLSWGIASWPLDGKTAEALVGAADARLYAMKRRP